MPLAECINRQDLFEYNQKKGISRYIDPFTQLFCVKLNHAPKMAYYYPELSLTSLEGLTDDRYKQGFGSQILGQVRSSTDTSLPYYKIGTPMRTQATVNGATQIETFRVPTPDMNGACNNNYAVHFLENKETECTQVVNLQKQCTSTLNPFAASKQLSVLAGQRATTTIPVTIEQEYFTYN